MLNTERPEAEKLFAALCAGFDRKASPERIEAYWRGCNRMALPLLVRVVDRALSEQGPDEIPSPKRLWGIARELRAEGAPAKQRDAAQSDPVHGFGQNRLLVFLLQKARIGVGDPTDGGSASDASLAAMIRAKNEICAAARTDETTVRALAKPIDKQTAEERTLVRELADVLEHAFEKRFQRRTDDEITADFEHFARTGHVRAFTPEEVSHVDA